MTARSRRAERLLPILSELRLEVRARSQLAHKLALKRVVRCTQDHDAYLAGLFDCWIEEGDPHTCIVCFASATEFGLALTHRVAHCQAAARESGSEALRALFWAALRRIQTRRGHTPDMHAAMSALPVPATTPLAKVLCARCESLRHDTRCAEGHAALHPVGDVRWRSFGAGVVCQTKEHQCDACHTRWIRRWSVSDPFTGWTITRHATAGQYE